MGRRKLRISSHLMKESLMENFVFCAVVTFSGHPQEFNFEHNYKTHFCGNILSLSSPSVY